MLKVITILIILTAFTAKTSRAADLVYLRLTVPIGQGSAMLVGAEAIDSGLSARQSKFAKIGKITESPDPLRDLNQNKTDIAVVSTAALSSSGATSFAIFDLPFLFSEQKDTIAVQQSPAGAAILASLHKQGLVGLGFWNAGMSQLFGAPVRNFDDLRGMRVCVPGSPTAGYVKDAKAWADLPAEGFQWEGNSLSYRKAGDVLVALGATPVRGNSYLASDEPWQSTCDSAHDVIEAAPMYVDSINVSSTPRSITSRGFRPLVFVVVMRETVWDSLTSRVQQGLIDEVAISADRLTNEVTNQELSAFKSLFAKGFVQVSTDEKDTMLAEKAWQGVAGKENAELLNLIISIKAQSRQIQPTPEPTSTPEKHGALSTPTPNSPSKLLFATDRRDDNDDDPKFRFANTAGTLSYGIASIITDPTRRLTQDVGKTELHRIDVIGKDDFVQKLATALASQDNKSVLVYVHGFWTTFEDAALSTQILSDDLNLGGVILLYSWPSNGQLQSYPSDEDRVLAGRDDFVDFLKIIFRVAGIEKVSVFAHSMGARLTTFALDHMSIRPASSPRLIQQVVLAAPDIDVTTFSNEVGAYRSLARKTTIYASAFDKALMCSEYIHSDQRLGQGGDKVFVSPGVDTIDASEVERPAWWSPIDWIRGVPCIGGGHSYYIDNLSVQEDIHELISAGVEPPNRHGLIKASGKDYWVFKPVN